MSERGSYGGGGGMMMMMIKRGLRGSLGQGWIGEV